MLAIALLSSCSDAPPPTTAPIPTPTPTLPTLTAELVPTDAPSPTESPPLNIQFVGAADLSDERKSSLADLIASIQAGVVQVDTGSGSGSGFIIDASGLVVTNEHVVSGRRSVRVWLTNGRSYEGEVLERNDTADLAVVQITGDGRFHPIAVGDSSGARVGDEVLALGFPLADRIGSNLTVTRGIISSTRTMNGVNLLQTDAAINPGNSGGPLVNIDGKVIGVNTSKIEETDSGRPVDNIGFAVSVSEIERRLPSLSGQFAGSATPAPAPTPMALLTPISTTRPVDTIPSFMGSVADVDYVAETVIATLALPAAAGGNGSLIYSLTPAVPGLSFDTQARQLTGTPTSTGTYSMTYRVTDADNNTADIDADAISFTITVAPDIAPSFTGRVPDLDYTAGTAVSGLTLPAAMGGNGPLIYSLTPAVPGLRFSPQTRQLVETPTSPGSYSMTYRVTDADDNTADIDADTISFTIKVIAPDTAPSFSDGVSHLDYTLGTAISGLILPAATGGNGALTYFLTPAVPGLTFAQATRQITGIPTAVGTYNLTYRVTDADANTSSFDSDAILFAITVAMPLIDYDADDDGLIEISNLEQLDAISYDPNGDGMANERSVAHYYTVAFPNPVPGMGCAFGCTGYELARDLDFASPGSYASGVVNPAWRSGTGWEPIGARNDRFAATFDGNDHTIFNLYIDRRDASRAGGISLGPGSGDPNIGLFQYTETNSVIRGVGLVSAEVSGGSAVGALVGRNTGTVSSSFVVGIVRGDYGAVGGLVGHNEGSILTSYARADVSACTAVGGLVGTNEGVISASYANGSVSGHVVNAGGLVGQMSGGSIRTSYATSSVSEPAVVDGVETCQIQGSGIGVQLLYYIARGQAIVVMRHATEGDDPIHGVQQFYFTPPPDHLTANFSVGGLVGAAGNVSISASYWDTDTSGLAVGVGSGSVPGAEGMTTVELQTPINYTGIYTSWNIDVDGDGDPDDIWDFGISSEYPRLRLE